ncbi:Outer membrane protein assembly factor BamA precursor [Caulifigura coniformis]|uniref:Outer membrane protein assembly factor BamA n=1 Tax=Caulifigura coniformis TaxID=2527983 RepID=A0A517SJS7_9PLAN|nr:BamA/TamA family outer membrane protein [Caulifigura coniformis]QDT56382.1 Outer membrane protein assembly factor BamA precursor [Caulifigura coniformis]
MPDAASQPMVLSLDDSDDPNAPATAGDFLSPPAAERLPSDVEDLPVSRELLDKPLVAIEIEGNVTIPEYAIEPHIRCRPKRTASVHQVEEDVNALARTRLFFNINPVIRMTDAGPVLVFKVIERPILNSVDFLGNEHVKDRELEAHLGLMKGHAFDVATNKECVERIRSIYRDKGYRHAEVVLQKGGNPTDRDVVFAIKEGAKSKVWGISFEGNEDYSDAILKVRLETKRVILWWLGGDYDPYKVESDAYTVTKYYNDLGYFDAKVTPEVREEEEKGKVYIVFKVHEGVRYQVRNIEVQGNAVVPRNALFAKQHLKPSDMFNARFLRKDVEHMKGKYDELGRLFAKVQPTPRFLEQPGHVDIVYQIDEDQPYRIGSINVHVRGDHPHSQEYVVRNQVNPFLKPGRLASGEDVRLARNRLQGSAFWDKAEPPNIDVVKANAEIYRPHRSIALGQSVEDESPLDEFLADYEPSPWLDSRPRTAAFPPETTGGSIRIDATPGIAPAGHTPAANAAAGHSVAPANPMSSVGRPQPQVPPQSSVPRRPSAQFASVQPASAVGRQPTGVEQAVALSTTETRTAFRRQQEIYSIDPEAIFSLGDEDLMVVRAQSPHDVARGQSIDQYGQQVPQNYFGGVSPQGDPFGDSFSRPPGEPGFVDVNIDVTEGRTGRLMFGVGVNSDAGLIGQFTIQEDNFDILRPPRSWADIVNGQAFRGRGQSFRLEAMPGNQVSRYLASWQDPFFMQTDYSLGVSGFYYNRFYNEWTEDRLGGRISVGRLLSRYWSFNTALRLENVDIRDFNLPAPQDLIDVKGDNFLSTAEVKLAHDSRDSAFMPTYGHLWDVSYEQGFGEFIYPRLETSFSQYFTTYERPDGFGKHILSFRTQLGWTGDNTPIFERYYAGGYSSFRGFAFRGVTPRDTGDRVGGNFMSLSSLEYMLPITADDNIRVVGFTDFGTVEENVTLKHFRLSVGFGFRLTIPAMGPAPIALDFAVPLMDEEEDNRRLFSFYVGFTN